MVFQSFIFVMSTEAMMHVKTEISLFLLCVFSFSTFFFSCFFISKNQFPRAVLIPFDPQPFFRELEEEELYVDLFLILIYVRSKRCFLR